MDRPAALRPASSTFAAEPASGAQPVQVSRFLRETLEAYASETVADEVLRTALALARRSTLPGSSRELRELIDVHLVQSATAVMGIELAEAVRQRLQPLVLVVEQMEAAGPMLAAEPPVGPSEARSERITLVDDPTPRAVALASPVAPATARETARPPADAPPDDFDDRTPTRELELKPFSVVLVAGREPDIATQLKERVDSRTAVIPVEEPARLLRDLRVLRAQPRMLLIDLRRPHGLLDAVRGEPALLDGALVLLWGASRELDADVRRTFPGARVVRCAPDATLGDVAAVVRLGPGR